jgi:arylsulfatase A-like enzyme
LPDAHKILLTDDTDVFLHEHAGLFDEKHRLEPKRRSRPAGKLEETQWFRNMATIADLLRSRPDKPFLLWAHLEGFRGCWDFPLSYRQRYQIDEDPDPYPDVALPEIIGKNFDPDGKQSIMEAYSGGVSVLDEALAGLLTFFHKEKLDQNTVLLFTSVRGFSLGEHDYIGSCGELYSENVHLPLFIRFPDGSFAGFRSQTLLQPADVWEIVRKGEIPEEPATVHSALRIGQEVIVTPDWFVYQKPAGIELYVKPDDRWEVNDVADRCPHILEQIVSEME